MGQPNPTQSPTPRALPPERWTCVEVRQVHYDRPPLKPKPTTPPQQARSAERAFWVGSVGQGRVGAGRSDYPRRSAEAGRSERIRVPPTLRQGLSVALRYEPNQFA